MKRLQKLLTSGLIICMLVSLCSVGAVAADAETSNFQDVAETDWYYDAVSYVVSEDLFHGTSASEFSPDGQMTRGMLVTVIGRHYEENYKKQKPVSGDAKFDDVSKDAYYAGYVAWAYQNKIVSGIGNDKFGPERNITRQDAAKMMYGYAKFIELNMDFSSAKYNAFPDQNAVANYAVEAFKWATDQGVINGSEGRLAPTGLLTRAQAAQILYNLDRLDKSSKYPAEVHIMTTEERSTLFDQKGVSSSIGTVYLPQTNQIKGNDGVCAHFTADKTSMAFVISNAPGATDYHVRLYTGALGTGEPASESATTGVDNGLYFTGLTIGEEYHLRVSSDTVNTKGCTAIYEIILYE